MSGDERFTLLLDQVAGESAEYVAARTHYIRGKGTTELADIEFMRDQLGYKVAEVATSWDLIGRPDEYREACEALPDFARWLNHMTADVETNSLFASLPEPEPSQGPSGDDDYYYAEAGNLDEYKLRIIEGGSFVYDAPDTTPAVWGQGDQVLWAEGEPLMISGPTGTGKSTIAAQLVAGRLGLMSEVLGMPIAGDKRPVLYLAMDRPSQLRRLLHRLFVNHDARAVLNERLLVWAGPLSAVINNQPGLIAEIAKHHGAGTVVVDSLFNAAIKLTDDEAGGNINRAFQMVVAEGIELLVLHHQRKASQDAGKGPKTIDEIYGSALITAGMGSVISIAGEAGDPVVTLSHLKQPADQAGPFTVEHDNQSGLSKIVGQFDPLAYLQNRKKSGATAKQCAQAMFDRPEPTQNQIGKAKRQLDRLHKELPQSVARVAPATGGDGGQQPVRWIYIEPVIGAL
jgi:replicative DNA helicase